MRGGVFRSAVPLVHQRVLNDAFEAVSKHSNDFLDFGVYDRLTRIQAASAQGFHHDEKLLHNIIRFCPAAKIQHHQLRDAIVHAVSTDERYHVEKPFAGITKHNEL